MTENDQPVWLHLGVGLCFDEMPTFTWQQTLDMAEAFSKILGATHMDNLTITAN